MHTPPKTMTKVNHMLLSLKYKHQSLESMFPSQIDWLIHVAFPKKIPQITS
jgi:hypothetical protein